MQPSQLARYIQFLRFSPWALGAFLIVLVMARYVALSSNVADLGFFLNNLAHIDSQWQRAFYGHVQPLMLLWGAGYQALPASVAPLVLVTFQTLALLGSVVAIWRVFGAWPGVAMLLYYPLWANALFDFHFDHLAVPLLAAFFIACERKHFGWATFAAASLVLIKEPFALQTIACGLYFGWLAFHQRGTGVSTRLIIFGSLLALFGASWFYGTTHWILPYFGDDGPGSLGSSAFSWLGSSISGMIWTLVSQPDKIISEIIGTPGKLVYLTVVFGLLAFVPLLRPAALIVALPLLMIAMLSRLDNYYGYANHYTAGLIVPVVIAFRDGLPVTRRYFISLTAWAEVRVRQLQLLPAAFTITNKSQVFSIVLLTWLLAGHWALASSPISRLFWSDKVWSYSWHAYVPTEREAMIKAAILAHVPSTPNLFISTQNTLNWGYLADHQVYLPFPYGVGEPYKVMDWKNRDLNGLLKYINTGYKSATITQDRHAVYVLLDLKRPYFVADKGCAWIYGSCREKYTESIFKDYIFFVRKQYDVIFEQDDFVIFHTNKPPRLNKFSV